MPEAGTCSNKSPNWQMQKSHTQTRTHNGPKWHGYGTIIMLPVWALWKINNKTALWRQYIKMNNRKTACGDKWSNSLTVLNHTTRCDAASPSDARLVKPVPSSCLRSRLNSTAHHNHRPRTVDTITVVILMWGKIPDQSSSNVLRVQYLTKHQPTSQQGT